LEDEEEPVELVRDYMVLMSTLQHVVSVATNETERKVLHHMAAADVLGA